MANFFERTWDKVQDVFDGDDDEKKKKQPIGQRPEGVKGWGLDRVNPNYSKPENEYGKNLWLTGGDQQSPFNSWDTKFVDRMFKQQDQITKEKGDLSKQFDREDATGVVTWDHTTDSGKTLKFGDVFDQGKFLGNIYDADEGRGQADLMMSAFTLSKEAQAAVGKDRNPGERLRSEVQRVREENNARAVQMQGLKEHQEKVDKVQDKISGWAGGAGDEIAAGIVGAGGGFATGASLAKAAKTPQQAAAAFLGATAFGAGSAILNRDDVTEQMANAYEVSRRAYEEDDPIGASMTSLKQGAGVLGRSLAPFSNLSRGIADATDGTVGDGISTFSTDRPAWALPVDIAATVADSVVSFGLAAPRAMYLTQMGAHTVGGVGELTVGQGTRWDASSGTFKNAYVDEEEGFTPGRAAAAWGAVGIDALQLGMVKGMSNQIARHGAIKEDALRQAGKDPAKDGSWSQAIAGKAKAIADDTAITKLDRKALGGKADQAVRAETIGGRRFFFDDTGKSIASRKTAAAFVPSEWVQGLVAARNARVSPRVTNAGPRNYADEYADELYKAAKNLNDAENPMRSALVNAFGEGLEEAVQEVLEQASFGHRASLEDVATSYAYGTAAGFGMSAAKNVTRQATLDKIKPLAKDAWKAYYDEELTDDVWNGLSKEQKLELAQLGSSEEALAQMKRLGGVQGTELGGNTIGGAVVSQFNVDQNIIMAERDNRKAGQSTHQMARATSQPLTRVQDRTAGGYVDYGKNPMVIPDDAFATDANTIVNHYEGQEESRKLALVNIGARLDAVTAELAAATQEGRETAVLEAEVAKLQDLKVLYTNKEEPLKRLLARAQIIQKIINDAHKRLADESLSAAAREQELNILRNHVIAYNREAENLARMGDPDLKDIPKDAQQMSAWAVINRSPNDNVGSYQFAIPVLSWQLVKDNVPGAYMPSQAFAAQMTFDFDGDRLSLDPTLIVGYGTFTSMASGAHAMYVMQQKDGPEATTYAMTATDNEKYTMKTLAQVATAEQGSAAYKYYTDFIDGLTDMLMERYHLDGSIRDAVWAEVAQVFQTLPDKSTDARVRALDAAAPGRVGARPINDSDKVMEAFLNMMLSSPLVNKQFLAPQQGFDKLRNEPAEMFGIVRAHISEFARLYGAFQISGRTGNELGRRANKTKGAGPVERKTAIRKEAALPAYNMFNTVIDLLGSDSLRAMQSLHLSPINTTDADADKVITEDLLRAAEEHMRMLAQNTHQHANAAGVSEFDVSSRVIDMARQTLLAGVPLKAGTTEDAAIFALLRSDMIDPATGRHATTAQVFAMEIIRQIEVEASDILRRDTTLADKIGFLKSAAQATRSKESPSKRSWGEATLLRETLMGMTIKDIVPSDQLGPEMAEILQAGGTVEQLIRKVLSMDEGSRSRFGRALRDHPLNKVENSEYSNLLDFVFEIANLEIKTILSDGKPRYTGVLAKRNEDTSKKMRELLTGLHDAFRTYTKGVQATTRAEQRTQLANMLEALPHDGRRLLEVLSAGFDTLPFRPIEGQPGRYYIPDWILDAVLEPDVKLAEMKIWLARTKLQFKKIELQNSRKKEFLDEDELYVSDTLTQLLLSLRDDPTMFSKIFSEMENAKSVEDFTAILLHELEGVDKPPILMYENHADLFHAGKPKGGWQGIPATYGSKVREATLVKAEASSTLAEVQENAAATADGVRMLVNVPVAERPQSAIWHRMNDVVKAIGEAPTILAPSTVLDTLFGAMVLTSNSHTKGKTSEDKEGMGAKAVFDAASMGFQDVLQEALAQKTGVADWADIQHNISLLKTATIVNDPYGQPIDLSVIRDANGELTAESLVSAMAADIRLQGLLTELLLPKAYSYNAVTDTSSLTLTGPTNLKELISAPHSIAFEQTIDGSYSLQSDFEYGATLSAEIQKADPDQVFALEQLVLAKAWARVQNMEGTVGDAQLRTILKEEYVREVRIHRALGEIRAQKNHSESALERQLGVEKQKLRKRYENKTKGKTEDFVSESQAKRIVKLIEAEATAGFLQSIVETVHKKKFGKKREEALAKNPEGVEDQAAIEEGREIYGKAPNLNQVRKALHAEFWDDPLLALESTFYIETVGDIRVKGGLVAGYLREHPEFLKRTPKDVENLLSEIRLREDIENSLDYGGLSFEQWELASRVVMSHILEARSDLADTTIELRLLPEKSVDGGPAQTHSWARFDPSYASRLDVYYASSPVSKAAKKMAQEAGIAVPKYNAESVAKLIEKQYGTDDTKRWTPAIAALATASTDTIPSASASGGSSLAGDQPKTMHAVGVASNTTFDEPPAEYLVGVTVERVSADSFVFKNAATGKPMRLSQINGAFGIAVDDQGQDLRFEGSKIADAEHYMAFTLAHLKKQIPVTGKANLQVFLPTHRPAGEKWRNNIYFDGVAAREADYASVMESLPAYLFDSPFGQHQQQIRAVLDAVKKKLAAAFSVDAPLRAMPDIADLEAVENYLEKVAAEITAELPKLIKLGPSFHKAALKFVMAAHVVTYADGTIRSVTDYLAEASTGKRIVTTEKGKEEVDFNPATDLPQMHALSKRQRDTLYEGVGHHGTLLSAGRGEQNTSSPIPFTFEKLNEAQRELARNLRTPIALGDSAAVLRMPLRKMSRSIETAEENLKTSSEQQLKFQEYRSKGLEARRRAMNSGVLHLEDSNAVVKEMEDKLGKVENNAVAELDRAGMPKPESFSTKESRDSAKVHGATKESMGFIVTTKSEGTWQDGYITPASEKDLMEGPVSNIFRGDHLVIDLTEFEGTHSISFLSRVLDYAMVRGIEIKIYGSNAAARAMVTDKFHGRYVRRKHPSNMWQPRANMKEWYAEEVAISRSMAQGPVSAEGRMTRFVVKAAQPGLEQVHESTGILVRGKSKYTHQTVALQRSHLSNVTDLDEYGEGEAVQMLAALKDPSKDNAVDWLTELGKAVKQRGRLNAQNFLDVKEAIQDLHNRLAGTGKLNIDKGTLLQQGMIKVRKVQARELTDPPTFYFEIPGTKPLKESEIEELRDKGHRIIFSSNQLQPEQTFYSGVVEQVMNARSNSVEAYVVKVTQEELVAKFTPGIGGLKTLTLGLPDDLAFLSTPFFTGTDIGADMIVAHTDMDSKRGRLAKGFAEMGAYLGFDLTSDLYFAAYGTEYDPNKPEHTERLSWLIDHLSAHAAQRQDGDFDTVNEYIKELGRSEAIDLAKIEPSLLAAKGTELANKIWAGIVKRMPFKKNERTIRATKIMAATMAYLTLPGTHLSDIRSASGFSNTAAYAPENASRRVPEVFAQLFDSGTMHEGTIAQFNRRFARENTSYDKATNTQYRKGWQLLSDYSLQYFDEETQTFVEGWLSFDSLAISGEHTGRDYQPESDRNISPHDGRWRDMVYGGWLAAKRDVDYFEDYRKAREAIDVTSFSARDVYSLDTGAVRFLPWMQRSSTDILYHTEGVKTIAPFFQLIELEKEPGGSDADVRQTELRISALASLLMENKEHSDEHHIHTLIRLLWYKPGRREGEPETAGRISLSEVNLALDSIENAIRRGYSPLYKGVIDQIPIEIADAIARKQLKARAAGEEYIKFQFWPSPDTKATEPTSINEYRQMFVSHAWLDNTVLRHPVIITAMDALIHQYQDQSADALLMPVSMDVLRDLNLISDSARLDAALQQALDEGTLSVAELLQRFPNAYNASAFRNHQASMEPSAMQPRPESFSVAQALHTNEDTNIWSTEDPSAEILKAVRDNLQAWDRDKGMGYPTQRAIAAMRNAGLSKQDANPKQHAIVRGIFTFSASIRLLNPPLAVSALVETAWRSNMSSWRHMLNGQSTKGIGLQLAKLAESGSMAGNLMVGIGYTPYFTRDQADRVEDLIGRSGTLKTLRDILHQDLDGFFTELSMQGLWSPLKKLNTWAIALQDLGRGTKSKRLVRTYMSGALNALYEMGVPMEVAIDNIDRDPGWIKDNYPRAHKVGVAHVNDMRGVQQTAANHMLTSFWRPRSESGNAGTNAFTTLAVGIPLMFSRYTLNFTETALGVRGFDSVLALMMDGQQKPKMLQAWSNSAKGDPTNERFNFSEITEGIDAMDLFVNMGIQHTQLFTLGLILSGLGLSGEDEETRRRRRLANMQGAGFVYDPRNMENDFRNASSLFLDFLPDALEQPFAVVDHNGERRSPVTMHWTVKQFLSPLLGMERYFETGDFRQVLWGFQDAIGSMPLFNATTLNKAILTGDELAKAAQASTDQGGPNALPNTYGFVSSIVHYYQYALMESSFLNAIYMGMDEYDRDPYVMPMRDSDGDLQRDIEGNTREMGDAHMSSDGLDGRGKGLQKYVDNEGNVQQGYVSPSNATTQMRVLAENRLSYALITSLFTGLSGQGSNLRYAMPVKTREFDKPELSKNQQKAVVLAAMRNDEGFAGLLARGNAKDAKIEDQANTAIALSFLDTEGNEVLTKDGAMAVFRGIVGGTALPDSEALAGVYVDKEVRLALQEEWLQELTDEGVKLGLSPKSALQRAKNIWYGPYDSSAPGIADILWNPNLIPFDKSQQYQQLNTTYITGPDGKAWATGFTRGKLLGALGLAPLQRMYNAGDTGIDTDSRGNTADAIVGINTGSRALKRVDDSWDIPTDAEIGDAITNAIENIDLSGYGRGGYGGGGGGGGGYAQRPNIPYDNPFRLNDLGIRVQSIRPPYANDIRPVLTDNVSIRREETHRQRFSSERGRLKPWQ